MKVSYSMLYKRNEAFRYEFKKSISATIQIEGPITHNITIIDVSPKGMKFSCTDKLPLNSNISIKYKIFEEYLQVNGSIVWHIDYGDCYHFGATIVASEMYYNQLISDLKKLAKTKPQ